MKTKKILAVVITVLMIATGLSVVSFVSFAEGDKEFLPKVKFKLPGHLF